MNEFKQDDRNCAITKKKVNLYISQMTEMKCQIHRGHT